MAEPSDHALLRDFSTGRSEAAFAELVRRHLPAVYAIALRQVGGDAHLAEDVTQLVFCALARKAALLAQREVLGGWLCRAAQFAARDIVRTERRRRGREEKAIHMNEPASDPGSETDWGELRRALDESLAELNDRDRDAVWLRFFGKRSFAEIGGRLRLTENTARMRVERALEKMRTALARRGVTSTAAALGALLAEPAAEALPAGLAARVTGAAAIHGASGAVVLVQFMTSVKSTLLIGTALAVAGAAAWVAEHRANDRLRADIARLQTQSAAVADLRTQNARLRSALHESDSEIDLLLAAAAHAKQLRQPGGSQVEGAQGAAFAGPQVHVVGHVKSPGHVALSGPDIPLTDALAQAGGLDDLAAATRIVITHRNPDGTVDQRLVNLLQLRKEGRLNEVRLQDNDIVYVAERML